GNRNRRRRKGQAGFALAPADEAGRAMAVEGGHSGQWRGLAGLSASRIEEAAGVSASRQWAGPMMFVQRHESEKSAGEIDPALAVAPRGRHVDADADGCAAAPLLPGIERYHVAQQNGGDELHAFDGYRRLRALPRMARAAAARRVHLAQ